MTRPLSDSDPIKINHEYRGGRGGDVVSARIKWQGWGVSARLKGGGGAFSFPHDGREVGESTRIFHVSFTRL
jgi:hypothetical protein